MNEEQKRNIDLAARNASVAWLEKLVHQMYGEPIEGSGARFDFQCGRHEMLCEIADALLRHHAATTFKNLAIAYKGKCDIASLPTYSGRFILDEARKREAFALQEAIERAGGKSFPIILLAEGARVEFSKWRSHETPDKKIANLRALQRSHADVKMAPNEFNDLVLAVSADLLFAKEPHLAQLVLHGVHWDVLDEHNIDNIGGLRDVAIATECFEVAATMRDVIKRYDEHKAAPPAADPAPAASHEVLEP